MSVLCWRIIYTTGEMVMKIKCVKIQEFRGASGLMVSARIEIQWNEDVLWTNLGLMQLQIDEWLLLVLLLRSGTKHTGVEFEYVDTASPGEEKV